MRITATQTAPFERGQVKSTSADLPAHEESSYAGHERDSNLQQ